MLIFKALTLLMFCSLAFSCKNNKSASTSTNNKLAVLTYYEQSGIPIYEVQLYDDSTFKVPEKYKVTELSSGTFRRSFTRCYFTTTKGENELCDFYYVDTVQRMFWINKGCGDYQNLKIEFWK
jgi:hypothetical protein